MRAKKYLGQHFLESAKIVERMVVRANIEEEVVVEIGPGKGILTRALLSHGKHVLAIEKDTDLIPTLEETFQEEISNKTLTILNKDILDVEESDLPENYALIGNIPYYITGLLFKKFLSLQNLPKQIVFLMQKEVAQRIVNTHKGSILSLTTQGYGDPELLFSVQAKHFTPAPKVDSAVLALHNISRNNFDSVEGENLFLSLVKQGFSQKRKKLVNNLSALFPKETLTEIFTDLDLRIDVRAEDVPLKLWLTLTEKLSLSQT